jgi:hypothetical protein
VFWKKRPNVRLLLNAMHTIGLICCYVCG